MSEDYPLQNLVIYILSVHSNLSIILYDGKHPVAKEDGSSCYCDWSSMLVSLRFSTTFQMINFKIMLKTDRNWRGCGVINVPIASEGTQIYLGECCIFSTQ